MNSFNVELRLIVSVCGDTILSNYFLLVSPGGLAPPSVVRTIAKRIKKILKNENIKLCSYDQAL